MEEREKHRIIQAAQLLKAIAHPIRLCLVRHLAEEEELNVSYFLTCMDASQSSVSQHLAVLRHLGIVKSRKEGQHHYYRLVRGVAGEIAEVAIRGVE